MMRSVMIFGAVIVLMPSLSLADVPAQISYQGILNDSEGQPVEDNVYAIQFKIYNAETEGEVLWESTGFIPIQTKDGLFQHILGSTNPLPDSLSRYSDLWVGITVDLEEELAPRTRLVSVPFSITSQYSDTTGTSLDKTIDAGELVIGTLDTARYSAYEDLASEDKIGDASDQVAAGEHSHTDVYPTGAMIRYEDAASIEIALPQNSEVVAKSATFPVGEIGAYFRIAFCLRYTPIANNYIWLTCNGETAYFVNYAGEASDLLTFEFAKLTETLWMMNGTSLYNLWGLSNPINIDVSSGLTINIVALSDGENTLLTLGNLIVEYDVD